MALKILEILEYSPDVDKILFLLLLHHTYDEIYKIDSQILIEADFLVNLKGRRILQKTQ